MQTNDTMTRSRFEDLADSFGGDIGRWPTDAQAAARALVVREPEAGRLLARIEAFDRLLDLAPVAQPSPDLTGRIVAAARDRRADPRILNGNVVDLATAQAPTGRASTRPGQRPLAPERSMPAPSGWRLARGQAAGAGGMLAASLLLGIWLGNAGIAPQSLGAVLANRPASAPELDAMSEIVQFALPLELLESHDEDVL
jgi:hypothetical protein